MAVILLCDNGSVRANATLQLRQLANNLGEKTGHHIHAVSFKHADRIATAQLHGMPAQVFRGFMTEQLTQGQRDFLLLPLFFGNSKALTSFVPDEVTALKQKFGAFELAIAEVIYPLPQGEPLLTDIIYDHIHDTADKHHLPLKNLVLVDHGSPIPRVTEVRKHLAQTVQQKLPAGCQLEQAVMERREGKEYDFNGALLEDWLTNKAQAGETSAIVILMFFLAGRHAGEGGDIVEICNTVMDRNPGFKVAISPLITEHPDFVSILQQRLHDSMQG
jgi:sirohydrochlorin ferrochelatase